MLLKLIPSTRKFLIYLCGSHYIAMDNIDLATSLERAKAEFPFSENENKKG